MGFADLRGWFPCLEELGRIFSGLLIYMFRCTTPLSDEDYQRRRDAALAYQEQEKRHGQLLLAPSLSTRGRPPSFRNW